MDKQAAVELLQLLLDNHEIGQQVRDILFMAKHYTEEELDLEPSVRAKTKLRLLESVGV